MTNTDQPSLGYANLITHSDSFPFEVVCEISTKTIVVRMMKAELDPTWKPEILVGGFSAHCSNQSSQRWTCSSDKDRPIIRIRKHKDGQWRDSHGNRYVRADQPRRFHDYNF